MIKTGRYRINRDDRGWITSGKKNANGLPTSLDYFNVSAFPEIVAAYGEKPQSLVVFCPANSLEEFFDDNFGAWGRNNTLKRQCDGIECVHRIKETINGVEYEQSEISECVCQALADGDKNRCNYGMTLKMFISHPDRLEYLTPICYGFRTGSIHSGDTIRSELQKMEFLSRLQNNGKPTLARTPFRLSVRMVSSKDNANQKFPIWSMQAVSFELPALPEQERPALNPYEPVSEDVEIIGESGDEVAALLDEPDEESSSKAQRPIEPDVLKWTLIEKSNRSQKRLEDGSFVWTGKPRTPEESATKAAIDLSNVGFKKKEERYAFNEWLFGKESQKELAQGQNETLIYWCGVTPEGGGDSTIWVPHPMAIKEADKARLHVGTWKASQGNAIPPEPQEPEDILGDGMDQYGETISEVK